MHTKGVLALVLITTLTLSPLTPATAAAPDQPENARHDVSPVVSDPGPSANGPTGSIGVHGHWEIEVRNPDGSLATRREFDNALFDSGAFLLGIFLSRGLVPGSWVVFFNGAPTPCHPFFIGTPQQQCFIVESRVPVLATPQGISKNLVVATDPLKLTGSITLPMAGSITTVQTVHDACVPTNAPATCLGGPTATGNSANLAPQNYWFTGTSIAPINVLAGQLVTLTITFTFSSAP